MANPDDGAASNTPDFTNLLFDHSAIHNSNFNNQTLLNPIFNGPTFVAARDIHNVQVSSSNHPHSGGGGDSNQHPATHNSSPGPHYPLARIDYRMNQEDSIFFDSPQQQVARDKASFNRVTYAQSPPLFFSGYPSLPFQIAQRSDQQASTTPLEHPHQASVTSTGSRITSDYGTSHGVGYTPQDLQEADGQLLNSLDLAQNTRTSSSDFKNSAFQTALSTSFVEESKASTLFDESEHWLQSHVERLVPMEIANDDMDTVMEPSKLEGLAAKIHDALQAPFKVVNVVNPDWTESNKATYTQQQNEALQKINQTLSTNYSQTTARAYCIKLMREVRDLHTKGANLSSEPKKGDRNGYRTEHHKCSERLELIIHAVRSNKRVALEIIEGHMIGMNNLARAPVKYLEKKEKNIDSNGKKSEKLKAANEANGLNRGLTPTLSAKKPQGVAGAYQAASQAQRKTTGLTFADLASISKGESAPLVLKGRKTRGQPSKQNQSRAKRNREEALEEDALKEEILHILPQKKRKVLDAGSPVQTGMDGLQTVKNTSELMTREEFMRFAKATAIPSTQTDLFFNDQQLFGYAGFRTNNDDMPLADFDTREEMEQYAQNPPARRFDPLLTSGLFDDPIDNSFVADGDGEDGQDAGFGLPN